jgi:hypothetical protein
MREANLSLTVLTLTVACSSTSITSNGVDAGLGGAGATTSVGGSRTGTGGRSSTAHSSLAAGGNTALGSSNTGGLANTSVGGASAASGATATGGMGTAPKSATSAGGAYSGGAGGVATSASGTGGHTALGGASGASGGLAQIGGTHASGGTTSPSTGGTPATGGASTSIGGAATGGIAATGGTTSNSCGSSPCKNGGVCSPSGTSFSCNCGTTGFTGTLCETNIDNCAGVDCSGHGSCVDGINTYSCNCNAGYSGTASCTAVPPKISQQPQDVTVCLGTGATFTVAATGAGTITYAWYQSSGGVLYGPYGTGPSYSVSGVVGSGTPTPPFTLSYVAIATDSANAQTVQSNVVAYSVANPPAFVIGNWGIDSASTAVPHLWVQLNAPASGCLYYTYSNDGSGFYVQQLGICAGEDRAWPNVGMPPDYATPGNNIVNVTSREGNSGLACETSSTWAWDGTTP